MKSHCKARRSLTPWLVALLVGLSGCQGAGPPTSDASALEDDAASPTPSPTPVPLPPELELLPSIAMPGQMLTAQVKGISTGFDASTTLELGAGVTVLSVVVVNAGDLRLELSIAADAAPGYRPLTVHTGDAPITLEHALLLQAGSVSITPAVANRGQTVDIAVTATGVPLTPGYTWIGFGAGVTTESFTPTDDTHAIARARVASDAMPGLRDVELQDGSTRILLPGGFTVDRGLISITFDPREIAQGTSTEFTLSGYGTHFAEGRTTLDLGVGLVTEEEDLPTFTVESPTRITGTMAACAAAVLGMHDVSVTTSFDSGAPEEVTAKEAFEVLEVPISVEVAYPSGSLYLYRSMVNGQVVESVGASFIFVGLVPRCGSSGTSNTSCSVPTYPYDQPSFYPPPGCDPNATSGSGTIQPPIPTFDAGDAVFLEIPGGPSIRLEKFQEADGSIYYADAGTIPVEDYWFDAAYDLRVEGGTGLESIPPFVAEGVLVTLPSDFFLTDPDLRNEPTLDRYDSIEMVWVDPYGQPGGHTFPTGSLFARVRTVSGTTGLASEIRVIPEDDGDYLFPAEYVSMLYAGSGRMSLAAGRLGPSFAIPGSNYSSQLSSGLSWEGYFEMR